MNVEEARAYARKTPKAKVAVLSGSEIPLLESGSTEVTVFQLIKDANAKLAAIRDFRLEQGDKVAWGSSAMGFYKFQSGYIVCLDRKVRKSGAK